MKFLYRNRNTFSHLFLHEILLDALFMSRKYSMNLSGKHPIYAVRCALCRIRWAFILYLLLWSSSASQVQLHGEDAEKWGSRGYESWIELKTGRTHQVAEHTMHTGAWHSRQMFDEFADSKCSCTATVWALICLRKPDFGTSMTILTEYNEHSKRAH